MLYDTDKVKFFIDSIFANKNNDEQILCWGSKSSNPGFPVSYDHFINKTIKTKTPKACYFSTATALPDDQGNLYNRQNLFSRMFCIVLDDIGWGEGAKCSSDDLPDELYEGYTWRIQTSPGNYQYGFLLEEPVDNLLGARDLVKFIYNSGAWDSGGAMPNKLVRLPCGVNIKDKYNQGDEKFIIDGECELLVDNVWTPDELLVAVNAGVTWAEIIEGTAYKIDPRKTRGATAWRSGVYRDNMEGVVDDVLEWLNDQEHIVNERDEWIDIVCPWSDEHSEGGGNTAGYKPLGYGDTPERRGFHCFHDSCKGRHTSEFLSWVSAQGGPTVPVTDPIPLLVSAWALDMKTNEFIDLKSSTMTRIPNAGFKTAHQGDVFWGDAKGKVCRASEYSLITKNPGFLKLKGSTMHPGEGAIVECNGELKVNDWSIPNWTLTPGKTEDFEKFCAFIKYLMPDDHEWFLDHIAAKVQDPTYRGPCVILTTPAQGTGRGTLTSMLAKLWGSHNVNTANLSTMVRGFVAEDFNDWLLSSWVVTPEARETKGGRRDEARAYESLKEGVDPSPTKHLIKRKYGGQGHEMIYASFVINTNHQDAVVVPPTDRRFFKIHCTPQPETPEFFIELHEWLEGSWEFGVWQGLSARDIGDHNGFAPVGHGLDMDEAREAQIDSLVGQSSIDRLVTLSVMFCDQYCNGLMTTKLLCTWIASHQVQLGVASVQHWEDIFKRNMQSASTELREDGKRIWFKKDGVKYYIRHTLTDNGYATAHDFNKDSVKDAVLSVSGDSFLEFVLDALEEAGL